jgi:PadR family transcriptional regulator PadR
MPRSTLLTRADEMLLVCILILDQDAFSTSIQHELHRRTRKKLTAGSLWVALDALSERGLVEKTQRSNPDRKGGRPRVYYAVTASGRLLLKKTRELDRKLWKNVSDELLA